MVNINWFATIYSFLSRQGAYYTTTYKGGEKRGLSAENKQANEKNHNLF
jgi:hypothetical protein